MGPLIVVVPKVEVSRAVLGILPHGSEIKLQWVLRLSMRWQGLSGPLHRGSGMSADRAFSYSSDEAHGLL